MNRPSILFVVAGSLVQACAMQPVPTEQLATSRAAFDAAIRAGAAESAPMELELARQKLELTRRWIDANDFKPARWLAEQAQVDAELAWLKARGVGVRR